MAIPWFPHWWAGYDDTPATGLQLFLGRAAEGKVFKESTIGKALVAAARALPQKAAPLLVYTLATVLIRSAGDDITEAARTHQRQHRASAGEWTKPQAPICTEISPAAGCGGETSERTGAAPDDSI